MVSSREMPSAGGARTLVSGREEDADVKDWVSVERRAGSVAGAAIA